MLRDLLVAQAALYGVVYAFLAYLGVRDIGIYVASFATIYVSTTLIFSPLPRRLRPINIAITIALVTAFAYYAALRIMAIVK